MHTCPLRGKRRHQIPWNWTCPSISTGNLTRGIWKSRKCSGPSPLPHVTHFYSDSHSESRHCGSRLLWHHQTGWFRPVTPALRQMGTSSACPWPEESDYISSLCLSIGNTSLDVRLLFLRWINKGADEGIHTKGERNTFPQITGQCGTWNPGMG